MSDSSVPITAGSGTPIDVSSVSTGSGTVNRQRMVIGDDVGADGLAKIIGGALSVVDADTTATITFTANAQTFSLVMQGAKSASVVLTGTWTGTVVFEVSVDGTNWVGCDVYSEAGESWVQSTTTNGSWWFEALGAINAVRVRTTAWTSGTANGTILVAMGDMNTPEYASGLGSTAPPNAVYVAGTDGTNLRGLSVSSTGVLNVQGNQSASTTGTITTSASVVGPLASANLNIVTVSINGTYAGVSFLFEGSDDGGTTYYGLQGVRGDTFISETGGTTLTNVSRSWDVAVGAYTHFRVRATAFTSGTATIRMTAQSMPYEPTPTTWTQSDNATLSNATSSVTNATLLVANPARKGVIIFNDGGTNLFLKYGATASATSFTYKIMGLTTWEMPRPSYTGQIDGIADTASGTWRITELK